MGNNLRNIAPKTPKLLFRHLTIVWMCLSFGIVPCLGQDVINFDHIGTSDGLSQSDINSIYQDSQGYMWFGTHDGLNKYDGYNFTVYKPDAAKQRTINSNLVFTITGDKEGNLWIGTTGSGLNYFDRATETFTQYQHDNEDENSLSNDHITTLYLDSKERLWVGTNDGVNMLDLRKKGEGIKFQRFNPEQEPFVTGWDGKSIFTVFEDSKNQIWVGGHGGLYGLSRDQKGDIYFKLVNELIGLPNNTVHCVGEDELGLLIIGTVNGLYSQARGKVSGKVHKLADGAFNCIQVDNDNHIWSGTNNGLLYFENSISEEYPILTDRFYYDPQKPRSLSKNIVKSFCKDHSGIIWIGTNGGGINKYDPEKKQFIHIRKSPNPQSLSYDKIRSMFEDSEGTLWIGTEGGGLNILKAENDNGEYDSFNTLETISKPFALAEVEISNKKTLLIGAENDLGLYQIDISKSKTINERDVIPIPGISSSVFTIIQDRQKNIWIGTYGKGIHRWLFDAQTGDYLKDVLVNEAQDPNSLSSDIVRNIYQDREGTIWVATGDGLCRLTLEESTSSRPKFSIYKNVPGDKTSITHNYILPIFQSRRGDIWVGTFGGGLNKFIPSRNGEKEHFVAYTELDGLANNVIKGILEGDEGDLWLSTNKGLSRLDVDEETFTNYDVNDGLQNNEFQELACLRRKNGEMLFGGVNGFNAFHPKYINKNKFEAETVITKFSISNVPVEIGEEINGRVILNEAVNDLEQIEIKFEENNLSFEFAALHYAAPRKNQFAYMLEGFDEDWVYTSSNKRFATYTNIQPGNYSFKVKASNNDGLWDATPVQLKIEIIPPWWRTNIAYAVYGILCLGLLVAFRSYAIIRTTEKHKLELEHLEKEKFEEMQRMKLEFFTNISHEFRTPLTLIKGPLEYLQNNRELAEDIIREQYGLIQKNANYLLRLVNQLLDFRKLDQGKMRLFIQEGDIVEFIKEISDPFQFMAHKKNINYDVRSQEHSLQAWFDPNALEKVLNNLLSNAFKFTPDHGTIFIEILESTRHEFEHSGNKEVHDSLLIRISDSGPGIPRNKIDEVFERFYVEREKRNRNKEGMGIGLSFTKSLVELHQGTISVSSEVGKGSVFNVILPKNKEAYLNIEELNCLEDPEGGVNLNTPTANAQAVAFNDEIVDRDLSKSRSVLPIVLVIDDNADIRTFIKLGLGDIYTIHEAENGKQGLEVAHQIMPNIILSDVLMPVMDGIEFCGRIKTDETTSHIPVVMLTAKSSHESELEGLRVGADDYLRKPFEMELLKVKLSNILSHRAELRKRFTRNIVLKPSEITVTSADEKFLQLAIEIVEKHMMDTHFSVEMLVSEMGLSRSNLYLKFKELTGLSSSEFIRNVRLKRAVQLLEKSDMNVKEIMYKTGFNTASYFAKCFKKQYGMIPSEYVRGTEEELSS